MIYFYEQSGDFNKFDEINLTQCIDSKLTIAHDKTEHVTFYDDFLMKTILSDNFV
jgi:hypothetical protein